jgi:hypothetical protein
MDRAVDPSEHGAVHLHPRWTIGVDDVGEDMIREGILAQDGQEQSVPPVVVVRGAIQNQGHEDLDVEDGDGGGVDGGVPGFVRVERSRAFVLLACRALGIGFGHGGRTSACSCGGGAETAARDLDRAARGRMRRADVRSMRRAEARSWSACNCGGGAEAAARERRRRGRERGGVAQMRAVAGKEGGRPRASTWRRRRSAPRGRRAA